MKNGLDWFKLDVNMDDKVELIEAEYGLTGFAVVVKLWQKIYGSEGYYCEWTNEVALLFSRKIGAGVSVVSEIVSASIKRGIFDKGMYERYGILTSAGIQKRYLEAVTRRLDSEIKSEYLLLNCTQKSKNVSISSKNVDISKENADISKQSRVDKSRVDKSREEKKSYARAREPFYSDIEPNDEPSDIIDRVNARLRAYRERNGLV